MPPEETPVATTAAAPATAAAAAHHDDEEAPPRARAASDEEGSSGSGSVSGSGSGSSSRQRPRRRPPTRSRTHRTVPLAEAIRSPTLATPPSLVEASLAAIADNCDALVDIQGLDEGLAVRLLGLILQRGKLDYRLCRVFIESGHPQLAAAVSSLNLYEGLSCQRMDGGAGFKRFSPGGCR